MSVVRFDRTGELVVMGEDSRPDCVEFQARAGEPTIDWLAEAIVVISGWMTRRGIATLYERDGEGWEPQASAMPYDALYVKDNTSARLVFSSYVRLQPGQRYRLVLAGALVVSPTIQIAALSKDPETLWPRRGWKRRRVAA